MLAVLSVEIAQLASCVILVPHHPHLIIYVHRITTAFMELVLQHLVNLEHSAQSREAFRALIALLVKQDRSVQETRFLKIAQKASIAQLKLEKLSHVPLAHTVTRLNLLLSATAKTALLVISALRPTQPILRIILALLEATVFREL